MARVSGSLSNQVIPGFGVAILEDRGEYWVCGATDLSAISPVRLRIRWECAYSTAERRVRVVGLMYEYSGGGGGLCTRAPRTPPPTGRAAAPRPTVRVAAGGRAGSGAERDRERPREPRAGSSPPEYPYYSDSYGGWCEPLVYGYEYMKCEEY